MCIAGQHPTTEDGLGSFQEAYGSEVCRSFSKLTKRVIDWSMIEVDLRQAFRDATNPPPCLSHSISVRPGMLSLSHMAAISTTPTTNGKPA